MTTALSVHRPGALAPYELAGLLDRLERGDYRSVTEAELQALAEHWLDQGGFLWFHDRDSRRNGAGLPDLIAVRGTDVLWIELKAKSKVKPEQARWRTALLEAGQRHYTLWPRDWRFLRLLLLGGTSAEWSDEMQRRFDDRHLSDFS